MPMYKPSPKAPAHPTPLRLLTVRTLEVELDLPLTDEDVAMFHEYQASGGMDEDQAARQLAQDILGGTGADVQSAQATVF